MSANPPASPDTPFFFKALDAGQSSQFLTLVFEQGTAVTMAWKHTLLLVSRRPRLELHFATGRVELEFKNLTGPGAQSEDLVLFDRIDQAVREARLQWIRQDPTKVTITVTHMELGQFPVPFVP